MEGKSNKLRKDNLGQGSTNVVNTFPIDLHYRKVSNQSFGGHKGRGDCGAAGMQKER